MSEPSDYEAEEYYAEVYAHISDEAIKNFTAERLRSFYDKEPAVAEKAFQIIGGSPTASPTPHYTAAFIHAVIASEVMLRGVVFETHSAGFVHSDSIAPFIVELAISSSGLKVK